MSFRALGPMVIRDSVGSSGAFGARSDVGVSKSNRCVFTIPVQTTNPIGVKPGSIHFWTKQRKRRVGDKGYSSLTMFAMQPDDEFALKAIFVLVVVLARTICRPFHDG